MAMIGVMFILMTNLELKKDKIILIVKELCLELCMNSVSGRLMILSRLD